MNSDNHKRKKTFNELKKAFDANPKLKSLPLKNITPFLTNPVLKVSPEQSSTVKVPLYSSHISAGTTAPADDHIDHYLDLNHHLIKRPGSTFLVRVEGNSMTGIGIYHHDMLIVDRSVKPRDGNIVIALIDNEFTVKRLKLLGKQVILMPENPDFKPIKITETIEFKIWGVVLHSVKSLQGGSNFDRKFS